MYRRICAEIPPEKKYSERRKAVNLELVTVISVVELANEVRW